MLQAWALRRESTRVRLAWFAPRQPVLLALLVSLSELHQASVARLWGQISCPSCSLPIISQAGIAGRGNSLLMKELNVAAFGACALSPPAVGGCAVPSSADMVVCACYRARLSWTFHRNFWRGAWRDRRLTFKNPAMTEDGPCTVSGFFDLGQRPSPRSPSPAHDHARPRSPARLPLAIIQFARPSPFHALSGVPASRAPQTPPPAR